MLSASPSEAPNAAPPSLPLHGGDVHKIPQILPRERVFPIQIGGELFKLSGASLSSDGSSRAFCFEDKLKLGTPPLILLVLLTPS